MTAGPTSSPAPTGRSDDRSSSTDVLVVGAGPVGVTLANHLGLYGIDTVVVDREREILDYPRAVGLDDESLRSFQTVGLAEELLADMMQDIPLRLYTGNGICFADIRPATREFGWSRRNLFLQPLMEETLRKGLARYGSVQLRPGCELTTFTQDGDGVRAEVVTDAGARTIVARYLVGADGGRSTVRKLTGLGFEGKTHARQWIVIDAHPDPLDAPYTALHCRPERPFVSVHLPYGYRRWEFMILDGEDPDTFLDDRRLRELLAVQVDRPEELNIVRRRVYTHNSRILTSFGDRRVLLAGDAAHLTPPWVGQGLNTGVRDATNLAWKLAAVVSGRASPRLIETYDDERRSHAKAMIDLADYFGALLSVRNRPLAKLRDTAMVAIRDLPGVRDYVLQMKFKPMPHYDSAATIGPPRDREGRASKWPRRGRASAVGAMFPQPWVEEVGGSHHRLDDVIGPGFALLGWRVDPLTHLDDDAVAVWESLGTRFVEVHPSRQRPKDADGVGTVVVEDLHGALRRFFAGRPPIAVVRPDRYLMALTDPAGLTTTTWQVAQALGVPVHAEQERP
jgi:3-(3-hydroxy-phenyl)propionate hydroxylase